MALKGPVVLGGQACFLGWSVVCRLGWEAWVGDPWFGLSSVGFCNQFLIGY